jgi:hypothetical protein
VRLHYKLKLAGIELNFDETMMLRDDGSVIDIARVTKWGPPRNRDAQDHLILRSRA